GLVPTGQGRSSTRAPLLASNIKPTGRNSRIEPWRSTACSRNGEVSMRSLGGDEPRTLDERDLIETFVERSRWHCRAAREAFSTDEFRPATAVLASTT